MQEIDVLMLADSHGIDPSTKGLYNFYVDCISTSIPAQRTWVGLTDEERKLVRNSVGYNQFVTAGEYAEHVQKATEFKLLEKNK